MKRLSTFKPLLVVLVLAASFGSHLRAADKPLPRPTSYVSDLAGVIDPQAESQVEAMLADLERKTAAQVAVVTVPSLDGRDVEGFANDLFKSWGIGQKGQDNGVLFLISTADKKMRIEVGYGLEPILPDGYVGRILDQAVVPHFRNGEMSRGIANGTVFIAQTIARDKGVTLSASGAGAREVPVQQTPVNPLVLILMLFVFLYLLFRHPWILLLLLTRGGHRGGGGGFGGGGFGGFGGGRSGGGGASRGW